MTTRYVLVVTSLIAGSFGAAVWSRAAPQKLDVPDIIRARRFELIDQTGAVRAVLGTDENRQTRLRFLDENGKDRAVLEINFAGDSSLDMLDEKGRVRATMHATRLGAGFSAFTKQVVAGDYYRSQSIGIGAYNDGSAQLGISSNMTAGDVAGGRRRANLGTDEKGNTSFFIADKESATRIHMRITEKSEPSITLYNSKSKPSWSTPKAR